MLKTQLLLLALVSFTTAVQAEVLSIADPSYQLSNDESGVLRPTQGMSMMEVEQKFGMPEQKFAAVGEPPITRWQYANFIVYFEHNSVIHSVVPRDQ